MTNVIRFVFISLLCPVVITDRCPNGWFRYEASCYNFLRSRSSWQRAKQICNQHNATMFVVDSYEEWNTIRKQSTPAVHAWLGLSWNLPESNIIDQNNFGPFWETEGGVDSEILPWAVRLPGHGRVTDIDCVAYYQVPNLLDYSKIYYRNCKAQYEIICERNATDVKRIGPFKSVVRGTVDRAVAGNLGQALGSVGIKGAGGGTQTEERNNNSPKISIDWAALARLFGN